MRAPACDPNPLDRRGAAPARLAGSQVHAMLQLKESLHPIGIHIIGDGRTAQHTGIFKPEKRALGPLKMLEAKGAQ